MSNLMQGSPNCICAIVVTYFPDIEVLDTLLVALMGQVAQVIIVDNTPTDDRRVALLVDQGPFSDIKLIRLGVNKGIALAINVGVEAAISSGASHVLLSDQDSCPGLGMVDELLRAMNELARQGYRVGAVGPTYTDKHTRITFPFQAELPGKFFYGHSLPSESVPIIKALTLITSGALIPVPVMRAVGSMREDFFIDHVDSEWSYRAQAAGYDLFGIGKAIMYHSMGDHALRVWYFGWRLESAYSPIRVYYRVRNFVALCYTKSMRRRWKVRNAWYILGMVYTQAIFGTDRINVLKMAFRGLKDGLCRNMGPFKA